MYIYDPVFRQMASIMLNVPEMTVDDAMQSVQLDVMNGVTEHLPFMLGDGVFCGPTTADELKTTGFRSVITNGICWAACQE